MFLRFIVIPLMYEYSKRRIDNSFRHLNQTTSSQRPVIVNTPAPCTHRNVIPVDTRDWDMDAEHERVSVLCLDCDEQLAPDFKPPTRRVNTTSFTMPDSCPDHHGVLRPDCDVHHAHPARGINTIHYTGKAPPGNAGGGGGMPSNATIRFVNGSHLTVPILPSSYGYAGGYEIRGVDQGPFTSMMEWEVITDPDSGEVLGYWRERN
jgi:hypothetical protein